MLGTHPATRGGVAAVVNVYRSAGLFDQRRILYVPTHKDGSRWQKLRVMVGAWFRFMALLFTRQVGLVHVHISFRASFWRKLVFMVPATWAGRPVLLHLHSGGFRRFYEEECGLVGKWFVRWAFGNAAKVIVLSQAWAGWVRTICPNQDLRVLYNPVLLPAPVDLSGPQRSAAHILFLGRMTVNKGVFDLLEAVAKMRDAGVNATLTICGDGDARNVRAVIEELGLDTKVRIVGWVEGDAKRFEIAHATVFCLPSYHEGMPMSVLEAMAAGVPVVSTRVGGIPEAITDGKEGWLVQPGDIEALSERLAKIIANPPLAEEMGAAARHKAEERFSARAVLPELIALYDEIMLSTMQ